MTKSKKGGRVSQRLPNRHPNRDFFIIDVNDARPKDEMASMEHPVYSLSVKPDMRELDYTAGNGDRLRVIPSGRGLATIMDKDIVLYCISKLVHMQDRGEEISPEVEVSAHEVMVACNWMTSKPSYEKFENAMLRLAGTQIVTDIKTGNTETTNIFHLIDSAEIVRKKDGKESAFGRLSKVKIKLSDWTFRAVQSKEVLTLSHEYFLLRRPLERRLYEIARKHVGSKNDEWRIGIEKLKNKVGTNAPLKKFRFNLKEIIRDDNIPDYGFRLEGDMVVMQRVVADALPDFVSDMIPVRADTLDKAQKIAAQLRTSVFDLQREWSEWSRGKAEAPDNPDAAFMAFCKQKVGSAPAQRVVAAREEVAEARQLGLVLPGIER